MDKKLSKSEKNNWIKKLSKSHPGKYYYFNVKTNKSVWETPKEFSESTAGDHHETNKTEKSIHNTIDKKSKKISKTPAQDRLDRIKKENEMKQKKIISALKNKALELKAIEIKSTNSIEKEKKPVESMTKSLNSQKYDVSKNDFTKQNIRNEYKSFEKNLVNKRLENLRNRLQNKSSEETKTQSNGINKNEFPSMEDDKNVCLKTLDMNSMEIEEISSNELNSSTTDDTIMEWEPITDELILKTVNEIRENINDSNLKGNLEDIKNQENNIFDKKFNFFIVIDTNIFLSNFNLIRDLLKQVVKYVNYPLLIIPYIVLDELDTIKHRSNSAISVNASNSIRYINKEIIKKNPMIRGEDILRSSEPIIDIKNPDDKILNCSLYIRKNFNDVILLSNDINLRNKAIFYNIESYSMNEFEKHKCDILWKYLKIKL